MNQSNNSDDVRKLVEARFNEYEIIGDNKSNNARHFILKNATNTKHLKIIKKTYSDANEAHERDLLLAVNNPHVIPLEDHGELNDENDYLLFPHVNGRTLDRLREETWDDAAVKKLCLDVIRGIEALKAAGISHRDIKPKNIIRDDMTGSYIILDLGIGYLIDRRDRNNSNIPRNSGIGSRLYSAPEQFRITLNEPYSITSETDQFSLAVTIYELVSGGIHPFISSDTSKQQSYAHAVTGAVTPLPLSSLTKNIDEPTIQVIERMMSIEPSRRFLRLDELKSSLGQSESTRSRQEPRFYLQMPNENKTEFIDFLENNPAKVDGVIVSASDTLQACEKVKELGCKIIVDPKTFKFPLNKNTSKAAQALNIPPSSHYDMFELTEIKDQLIVGCHNFSKRMLSDIVILPYFNIEGANSSYLKFTKRIWDEAKDLYRSNEMSTDNIYGGIIIPYGVIISTEERGMLMSQLMSRHPIDGLFVSFENAPSSTSSIATTVDKTYLEGIKELCEFLETQFNNIIVYRTDISAMPFLNDASYATGWAKSVRHFSLSGSGRNGDYKMKYYAPKLFTFIEEKPKIRQIIDSGGYDALDCDCTYCKIVDPLDRQYDAHANRAGEKCHFFTSIAELHSATAALSVSDKDAYYVDYLSEATTKGNVIKRDSGRVIGSETIPGYETLVTLIND